MSDTTVELPAHIRISQSNLTDKELAFLADYMEAVFTPPGWTKSTLAALRWDFREASRVRGIQAGCKVVTQTVDLRS